MVWLVLSRDTFHLDQHAHLERGRPPRYCDIRRYVNYPIRTSTEWYAIGILSIRVCLRVEEATQHCNEPRLFEELGDLFDRLRVC